MPLPPLPTKSVTIDRYPTWSPARARDRAKELRKEIDKEGRDPASERRERREAATIKDLIDRYIRDHLPSRKRMREREERRMLAEIGHLLDHETKVASIHYGDMEALHAKITNGYDGKRPRPIRANRVLAVASKMFSLALRPLAGEDRAWRNAVDGNPCRGIPRNHEEGRGRLYSPAQLAVIAEALATYPGDIAANCIKLCMLHPCTLPPPLYPPPRWEGWKVPSLPPSGTSGPSKPPPPTRPDLHIMQGGRNT
jgi:hypothetical protein